MMVAFVQFFKDKLPHGKSLTYSS